MNHEDCLKKIESEAQAINACIAEYRNGSTGFITTAAIHASNCVSLIRMVGNNDYLHSYGSSGDMATDNAGDKSERERRQKQLVQAQQHQDRGETVAVFVFLFGFLFSVYGMCDVAYMLFKLIYKLFA